MSRFNRLNEFANHESVFADGARVPCVNAEDAAAFYASRGMEPPAHVEAASDAVMDDEDAMRAAARAAALEEMRRFKSTIMKILVRFRALQTDCLIFGAGFGHLIGCESQTDIVKRHGGSPETKANVNKYIMQFQRIFGKGRLAPGQRSVGASLTMKHARNRQLQKPSTAKGKT